MEFKYPLEFYEVLNNNPDIGRGNDTFTRFKDYCVSYMNCSCSCHRKPIANEIIKTYRTLVSEFSEETKAEIKRALNITETIRLLVKEEVILEF
jgi:hypothetical protein